MLGGEALDPSRCSGGCAENQGSGRRLWLVGMDPEGKNESGGGADGTGWMGRLGLGLPR